MSTPASPQQEALPLYDRIGGRPAIEAVVQRMYERILEDPQLEPSFRRTDLAWLRASQADFLVQLAGGPMDYKGGPMKQAHAHLRIEPKHFELVTGHLGEAMVDLDVPPALRQEL